jgi:cation diffusion facilitator family transporter
MPPDAAPAPSPAASRRGLTRFAWLSIGAAVLTIGLKSTAWLLTDSVGLLSDAVESLVNLAGGVMALAMLTIAARPADEDHAYGHSKAEYFASGVEGTLILFAAVSIAVAAVPRLLTPQPLAQLGAGLVTAITASLVNLVVALLLLQVGRRHHSITLEANAHHLLTDVWTSVAVLAGVGLVAWTGWQRLDPAIALLVAGNIVRTGTGIVRRSVAGLMDVSLPPADLAQVEAVLAPYREQGLEFHALRTRQAGARRFVSFHVVVPGEWTVNHGHELLEEVEAKIRARLPGATVFTHLEALDDPRSWEDTKLERTTRS